jgi:hypothetical protein
MENDPTGEPKFFNFFSYEIPLDELDITELPSFSETPVRTVLCTAQEIESATSMKDLQLRCGILPQVDQETSGGIFVFEDISVRAEPFWKKAGGKILSIFGVRPVPSRTLLVANVSRFRGDGSGPLFTFSTIIPDQSIRPASEQPSEGQIMTEKLPPDFCIGLDPDGTIVCRRVDVADDPDNKLFVVTRAREMRPEADGQDYPS